MNDARGVQSVLVDAGGRIDHPQAVSGAAGRTPDHNELIGQRAVRKGALIRRVRSAIGSDVREACVSGNRRPDLGEGIVIIGQTDSDVGDLTGDRPVDVGGDDEIIACVTELRIGNMCL